MKLISGHVVSKNRTIPYSIFKQETDQDTLAIILPGAGYTTQAPLLHYTKGLFINKGFDVLLVNYSYPKEVLASLGDDEFTADVQKAIDAIISEHQYSHFYIAAKSIGTIALAGLLENPLFNGAKAIWLTPLLTNNRVFEAMLNSKNHGLSFIGDKDPNYNPEKFESLKNNHNIQMNLIADVNHSLEIGDRVLESIDVHKYVIDKISDF